MNAWDDGAAAEIMAEHRDRPGALLPMLIALQDRFGFVAPDAVPAIAETLNLSRAEVHGVVSFYHDFRTEPPGTHVLRLCRAEACQARGARALADHLQARLHVGFGETTVDRRFTLEPAYCLGNCALGPALSVDGRLHGRVTPEAADAILADPEAGP